MLPGDPAHIAVAEWCPLGHFGRWGAGAEGVEHGRDRCFALLVMLLLSAPEPASLGFDSGEGFLDLVHARQDTGIKFRKKA
jgi:hypothetical protein